MYKIPAFILLTFIAFACDNTMGTASENTTPEELAGTWTLEGIEPANPVMEGNALEDMDFRETYTFNDDGTFTKSREDGTQAQGTLSLKETEDGTYYMLSYSEDAPEDLLSSCQYNEESLKMEGDKLVNDSRMCDRPKYIYSRTASEK
jgi:hypothetical protein